MLFKLTFYVEANTHSHTFAKPQAAHVETVSTIASSALHCILLPLVNNLALSLFPSLQSQFATEEEDDPQIHGSTSRTMAAISLGFIVIVTPWTILEIVATCTGSKVSDTGRMFTLISAHGDFGPSWNHSAGAG